jgi:hypothetical protein
MAREGWQPGVENGINSLFGRSEAGKRLVAAFLDNVDPTTFGSEVVSGGFEAVGSKIARIDGTKIDISMWISHKNPAECDITVLGTDSSGVQHTDLSISIGGKHDSLRMELAGVSKRPTYRKWLTNFMDKVCNPAEPPTK